MGARTSARRRRLLAAVGVEQLQLGGGQRQLAMLVLAVEREQRAAELLQIGLGGGAAADVGARAPVGPHPSRQHELLGALGDPVAEPAQIAGSANTPST